MGQLRFCLRQDADPASYGSCQVEEINGFQPHGSDVMLFAKRYMADTNPCRVMCLVPASVCVGLRAAFQQPAGLAPKRGISENLVKNIQSFAPRCMRQGMISQDACSYLLSWVDGSLQQIPRPTQYRFLSLRRYDIVGVQFAGAANWAPPRRARNIVVVDQNDFISDSDDDEGPVVIDE